MILETFYAVMRADTEPLDKSLKQSEKTTDDFVKSLKDAEKQSKETGKQMSLVAKGALAWLGTLVSVGATVRSTLARLDDANLLGKTSKNIDSSVESVDAFRKSVVDMGGTAEGAISSLTNVFKAMGRAVIDVQGSQARAFQMMGVDLRNADGSAKGATQGILEIAEALEGVETARARVMLSDIGIGDEKTIQLILKGRKAVEEMSRAHIEQGVVTQEMADKAARLDSAMNGLRSTFDRIKMSFDFMLLPAIEKSVEWLQKLIDWVSKNQRTVTVFFAAVAAAVLYAYVPAMVAAAAATLAATWPILAIGAAVAAAAAAFALIYDDISAFVAGNDSFIGQIFEKYPMVEKIVMGLVDAFKFMFEVISDVARLFKDFIKMAWAKQFELVGKAFDKVKGWFGSGDTDVAIAKEMLLEASSSPMNSVTSNSISNRASTTNEANLSVGEITIVTQSTDAAGIAADTRTELDKQLESMSYEFASGVAR